LHEEEEEAAAEAEEEEEVAGEEGVEVEAVVFVTKDRRMRLLVRINYLALKQHIKLVSLFYNISPF